MQPLPIVTYPDSRLSQPTEKITAITTELSAMIERMILTVRDARGVGLAAPQIGKNLALTVIEHAPTRQDDEPAVPLQVLINPKIISASRETETEEEGCLSIPGILVPVPRSRRIKVKALDQYGNKTQFRASGFYARIIQHEIDHLNGRLIIDYAKDRGAVLRKYRQPHTQTAFQHPAHHDQNL